MQKPVIKERIRFNVAGFMFETFLETLNRFPHTLLGDVSRRKDYFDSKTNVYFLNRSPAAFEAILYFYQSNGCLIRPKFLPMDIFEYECEFYNLGEKVVNSMKESEGLDFTTVKECTKKLKSTFMPTTWLFLEEPYSSIYSRIFTLTSILLIVLAVITDCLSTLDVCYNSLTPLALKLINFFANIFYGIEFIVRLISAPSKTEFMKSTANALDFISIFISIPLMVVEENYSYGVLSGRCLKMIRIFRLFRTSKIFRSLSVVMSILTACFGELFMLLYCIIISFTIVGNIIYLVELEDRASPVTSVPEGIWLAMQTMVTLGYGDVIPSTILGKISAALAATVGAVMAIPLFTFGGKFVVFYAKVFKITVTDCKTIRREI